MGRRQKDIINHRPQLRNTFGGKLPAMMPRPPTRRDPRQRLRPLTGGDPATPIRTGRGGQTKMVEEDGQRPHTPFSRCPTPPNPADHSTTSTTIDSFSCAILQALQAGIVAAVPWTTPSPYSTHRLREGVQVVNSRKAPPSP